MIREPVTSVTSNGCDNEKEEVGAFRSSTEPFQDAEKSDNELDDDEDFEEEDDEEGDEENEDDFSEETSDPVNKPTI
jgi:hypothetical protein